MRERVTHRTAIVVAGIAVLLAVVVAVVLPSRTPGPPWVPASTTAEVERAGVVYVEEADAFLVERDGKPLAFVARSTHLGEPILFCRTAEWFFSPAHGEKWDRLGIYADGPAPRGLDRLPVHVWEETIYVDPTAVSAGPPRGPTPDEPSGPFCGDTFETVEPGIAEPLDE